MPRFGAAGLAGGWVGDDMSFQCTGVRVELERHDEVFIGFERQRV